MSAEPARAATLVRGYEVVIGIETHAQLSTQVEDLQRRLDRVRRGAEHAGRAGRSRAAGHAAGRQPRRGRARDPLRPRGRRAHRAAVDLRAQELLLSRPAEGLPDQPVRDAGGAGRRGRVLRRRRRAQGGADARAPGGRRRQVAARRRERGRCDRRRAARVPGRVVGNRPEPRRHAAARDRHRARHALERRGGRVRARAARARRLARHLRRQHAGRELPLRRQRVGAPAGRAVRHPARDQEPEQLPLHAAGDRLRGAVADRPDRGRRHGAAGDGAVRRRSRRDAGDAQQGRRARLPLLPRPRPAAARDRRRVDRAHSRRHARAAARARRALPARLRARRVRRGDDDAERQDGDLLRGGARPRAASPSWPRTGSWARSRGA